MTRLGIITYLKAAQSHLGTVESRSRDGNWFAAGMAVGRAKQCITEALAALEELDADEEESPLVRVREVPLSGRNDESEAAIWERFKELLDPRVLAWATREWEQESPSTPPSETLAAIISEMWATKKNWEKGPGGRIVIDPEALKGGRHG